MCQNSYPFPIAYVGPKHILRFWVVSSVLKLVIFLEWKTNIPSPNPKDGVPHFGRHLRLLIQYTGIYLPYLAVFSSICNLTTLHAMVTGTHISWTDEYKHSKLFWVWLCCCCETLMKLNNMLTYVCIICAACSPQCRYLSSSKSKQQCVTSWKTQFPSNTTVRASKLV